MVFVIVGHDDVVKSVEVLLDGHKELVGGQTPLGHVDNHLGDDGGRGGGDEIELVASYAHPFAVNQEEGVVTPLGRTDGNTYVLGQGLGPVRRRQGG